MEAYKREENYKDPVRTTKSIYFVLGLLYVVLGAILFVSKPFVASVLIPLGILLLVIAYLLSKRNILGIYLGWLFVVLGFIGAFLSSAFLSLLLVAYVAFWNYKADKAMRVASVPKPTTDEQQPEQK